jgi:MFS superfamily sulfate permease-like transporter
MFLAPMFSYLPEAVLGAVIIEAVVMGMMDIPEMKRIYKVKPVEFLAAMAALLGVMTFGILQGVVIGVALSIVWLVAVSALPYIPELGRKPGTHAFFDLQRHPNGQTFPGLSILRFDDGLFFVNADALGDRLRDVRIHADPPLNGVILSMEGVNFMDAEGADAVKKIAQAGIDQGIDLHLARVKPQVMEVLDRDEVIDLIGAEHIHDDIAAAVELHLKKHPSETTDSRAAPDSQPAVA